MFFFNTNEHAQRLLLLQLGALWRLPPQSGAEYSRASSVLWFIFNLIHDKHCGVNLFNSNSSNKFELDRAVSVCCLPSSNLGPISRPCSDRRVSLNPTPRASLTPLLMVVGHPWVAQIMVYYNNNMCSINLLHKQFLLSLQLDWPCSASRSGESPTSGASSAAISPWSIPIRTPPYAAGCFICCAQPCPFPW